MEYFFHQYFTYLLESGLSVVFPYGIAAVSFAIAAIAIHLRRDRATHVAQWFGWASVVLFFLFQAWARRIPALRFPGPLESDDYNRFNYSTARFFEVTLAFFSMVLLLHLPVIYKWLSARSGGSRSPTAIAGVLLGALAILGLEMLRYQIRAVHVIIPQIEFGNLP